MPEDDTGLMTASTGVGTRFRERMAGAETKAIAPAPKVAAPNPDPNPPKPGSVPLPVAVPAAEPNPVKKDGERKTKEQNFKELNDAFDKFRATSEARVKELEKQLGESSEMTAKELKAAREQADTYKTIVNKFYLEHDPEFQKAFDQKITQATADAVDAIGGEEGQQISRLLKLPTGEFRDSELEKVLEPLSQFKRDRFNLAYAELTRTQRQRTAEVEKANENVKGLDEYNERQQRDRQTKSRQLRESAFSNELNAFASVMPDFKEIEGNAEHNKIVAENRQRAKDWLSSDTDETDFARMALYASRGYNSLRTDAIKDALIAKLQEQVKGMTREQPALRGTGGEHKPGFKPGNVKDAAAAVGNKYQQALEKGVPA